MSYYLGRHTQGNMTEEELRDLIWSVVSFNPWGTVFDLPGYGGRFGRLTYSTIEQKLAQDRYKWENYNLYGGRRICHHCKSSLKHWKSHTLTKKHRKNVLKPLFEIVPTDLAYLIGSFLMDTRNPHYYKRSLKRWGISLSNYYVNEDYTWPLLEILKTRTLAGIFVYV